MSFNTLVQSYCARFLVGGLKVSDFFTELSTVLGADVVALIGVAQQYYIQVGNTIMLVILIEAVYLSMVSYISTRLSRNSRIRAAKKPAKTMSFIREAILGYGTDFGIQFAVLDYFILMALIFGGMFPVVTLGSFVYLSVSYPTLKSLFTNKSRAPGPLRTTTIATSIRSAYFGILCRLFLSLMSFSDGTVWPLTSQFNLLQFSLAGLASSATTIRLTNMGVYAILLVIWIIYLIVHATVYAVLRHKSKRAENWMAAELKELEPNLEQDEGQNNYINRKEEIAGYVLPTYAMFKNPENAVLKAAFLTVGCCVTLGRS
jgi:hypothetical protein